MKARMKKILAMGLSVVLAVGTLTGCGGDNKEGNASGPASKNNSAEKKTFEDLGGLKVRIGDWYTAEDDGATTDYAKKTQQYRKKIQSDYKFTISRSSVSSFQDMQEEYVNAVMANNPKCELYYLYQEQVNEPLMNGLMKDLSKLPEFDFTEEKWNSTVTELMTIGNGIWGMNIEDEPRGGIFFNKRLLKEAGIDPEEPYNLQKEGKWTWDVFEEYCKKLTKDTDGDGKTDQYAMASFNKYYLPMCAATNNSTFVTRKDGKYENAINSQEFKDAMNWGVDLIKKGYIMPTPEGAGWDYYKAAFRDAECAMQTSEVYEISAFANMDDEWGFVMFPYNQDNKDATNATIPNDNIVVMPSCISDDEAEKIAFAYDLYTEPTPGYTKEDAVKERYYPQFKDERSVNETLEMMSDPKHKMVSYVPMVSGIETGDFCYGVYALAVTPQKKIEELSTKWDTKITEANASYEKFASAHK